MGIPRIIHQTAASFDALAGDVRDNVARVRALNPGWEYRFYDDAAVKAYLRTHLQAGVGMLIDRLNPAYGVVLADLFRYLVVYREGGAYLDIKSGMESPLDTMIEDDDCFLLSQWRNRLGEPYPNFGLHEELLKVPGGEFQQWHVIAAPEHAFPLRALNIALANMRNYDAKRDGVGRIGVLRLSGPIAYTRAIYPLIRTQPYRLVDSYALGLRYVMYPWTQHVKRTPGHYSKLEEPIMLAGDA